MKNEKTSKKIAKLAARLVKRPETATAEEIKSLAASALTQAADAAGPDAYESLMETLRRTLAADEAKRFDWQFGIAEALQIEFDGTLESSALHEKSNLAARRFLDMFLATGDGQ
jgi:hypothetical protein